jgi:cbb3-type cytochrome oxidase maturation protein
MLPSSLTVLLTGLFLGAIALGAFVWAWRRGQFDHLEAQAHVIFDERDYRLERPWETEAEREERRRLYGEPVPPDPGEWGGAR